MNAIMESVVRQLESMPRDQQYRVLEYARTLAAAPCGVPGRNLLAFAGVISADDLRLMSQAIEQGCEQVDQAEVVTPPLDAKPRGMGTWSY